MVRLYFKRGRVRTGCKGSAQHVACSLQRGSRPSWGLFLFPGRS